MQSPDDGDIAVSGVGVTAAIGQGRRAFLSALLEGRHRFDVMGRPGRQFPADADGGETSAFLGAEIAQLSMPAAIPSRLVRAASWSGQVALATLHEAWADAELAQLAPERIGLVVGGSNVQQRDAMLAREACRGREPFLRPAYGLAFLDSDLCGLCTEAFGIRGFAFTVGGASASGQLAVIEAVEAVGSGRVDACIALGALMDLSCWECQGLRSLGAMGSDRYAAEPALACRPFDRERDGFIYGESCAALVIERSGSARRRGRRPHARVAGWGLCMDANRNPDPSAEGEMAAIAQALARAGLRPADIDYVNLHGTGSAVGDTTELLTLERSGLRHARLNATKAITGHGLTAAGAVELVAVVLQMNEGRLHPTRNLEHPIAPELRWVGAQAEAHASDNALNLSMGFGGINTAVCLQRA